MLRSWVLGGLCGLLLASVLRADPGTVTTKDGQTFSGEITLKGDQVIIDRKGIKTTLARDDIRTIVYAASVEEEYRRRHERLARYDVPGRLELAQWLLEKKAYSMAQDVLEEARQVQPRNPQVLEMVRIVLRQSELDARQARKKAPVEVATITENPSAPAATAPASRPPATRPLHLLTPEEINYVRQQEWLGPELDQVRVVFRNDVRRKFVSYERDRQHQPIDSAGFNALTPPRQATAILGNGTPEMKQDVILASDPRAITRFRVVQRSLLLACASCHTTEQTTSRFALVWPANNDAATYTNFLVLMKYNVVIGKRTYDMVDRGDTRELQHSLLINFAVPPAIGVPPHPSVQNYNGVAKSLGDNRIRGAIDWITTLYSPAPDYSSIDIAGPGPTTRPAK